MISRTLARRRAKRNRVSFYFGLRRLGFGVLRSHNAKHRRKHFESFLAVVSVLSFGGATGLHAEELRNKLERGGEGIGAFDTLIAATA